MNDHIDRALEPGTTRHKSRAIAIKALGLAAALTVVAVVVVVVAQRLQRFEVETAEAVDDIESRLAGLDPVTRAAVVARLSSDGINQVRDAVGNHE